MQASEIQGYLVQDTPDELRFRSYPVSLTLPALIRSIQVFDATRLPPDAVVPIKVSPAELQFIGSALALLRDSVEADLVVRHLRWVRALLCLMTYPPLISAILLNSPPFTGAAFLLVGGLALGASALSVLMARFVRMKGKY